MDYRFAGLINTWLQPGVQREEMHEPFQRLFLQANR
jgi:hypothetical protein